jgi:hypothetical protein
MAERMNGGAIALGVGVGLVWLALAGAGLSAAAGARAGQGSLLAFQASTDGARLLAAGVEAEADGEYERADGLYRAAWADPVARQRAAEALDRLHRLPRFQRPVDESQVAAALDALGAGFARVETDHFVILSDADRDWTAARATLLERTQHQLTRVMRQMRYPIAPAPEKLLVVFFRDHADYRAFAAREDGVNAGWIAGYYSGLANRAVFYDDTTSPAFVAAFDMLSEHERSVARARDEAARLRRDRDLENATLVAARADDLEARLASERERLTVEAQRSSEAKTIHEAVHLLAFNCGVQSRAREYPFWITEGLAASFETERSQAAFGPDRETAQREGEFARFAREGRLLPLADFVSRSTVPEDDAEVADVMYAQAHALFAYLHRYERRDLGELFSDFWARPAGASTPADRLAMFEARFGPVDRFERKWLRLTGAPVAQAE